LPAAPIAKTALTFRAKTTELKKFMEFSDHTQLTKVIRNYVFGTNDSMKIADKNMDHIRPKRTSYDRY
jgi:hypothetical protein